MQYPKTISELLRLGHKRLDALAAGLAAREEVLAHVKAALPPEVAERIATAGFERGRLSLGVTSGAWASRARYAAEEARQRIGQALGAEVTALRVRVARPPRS